MKIVVLDGYTLNPGDLSWNELEALGACTVYERTPAEETVARASDADIILTNKTILDAESIHQLSQLKYIGVLATGYNVVDTAAAAARGIPVCNVPEYASASVAQMVFAHMLNLSNNVALHSAGARKGEWSSARDFAYWLTPQIELAGKTLGIVGLGRIGHAVAKAAQAFGMQVAAYRPSVQEGTDSGIEMASLERIFRESDFISLHCPLNADTQELVNAERLNTMKPGAFLINTGRGPLIDEQALADALNAGRIAGAGLDVLSSEPPAPDNPLLSARNCYITPHIAWATADARRRLMDIAVNNVKAFINGQSQNVVNEV